MSQYALIAEFDCQQTAIYRQSVESHAIEPVLVRDGVAASRILQSLGAPVLLICDVSLPRVDGFTVIAEMRRLSPPDRSAVLVFSGIANTFRRLVLVADLGDPERRLEVHGGGAQRGMRNYS